MDSINLSNAQNTPLNCRNTACNTNPITCACCGAKDYIQTFPQAFCYPALHPGIPSYPVIHPFFHNPTFPTNFVCAHNLSDGKVKREEGKQVTSENDKISRPANHFTLSQKEKSDFRDNTVMSENAQKKNFSEPEMHQAGHPFYVANSGESQHNPLMQRCACGDHSPWTCSPVITPIISYCLFWNSQKSNISIIPTNYSTCSTETFRPKSNEYQKYSESNTGSEKFSENLNTVRDANNNAKGATQTLREDRVDGYPDLENNEQVSENSLASLSLNSLNFIEKNSVKDNEKEDESNLQSKTGSFCAEGTEEEEEEGEDSELETLGCMDQEDSEECLKLDETTNINDDCHSPLDSGSHSNIGKPNRSRVDLTNASQSDAKNSASDIVATSENAFNYQQDHTSVPKKEEYTSGAAMGDLGGDHCEGYKVNILLYEGDQQNDSLQETGTETEETFATKEILLRELRELEENIADSPSEKNTNESIKSGKSYKSGIAKLTNTSKSKESKTDFMKNSKQSKESHQIETSLTKRKHNCINNDNALCGNDNSQKIQKTRNCTVQQQVPVSGPEKQQKELHCKCQPAKKEDKISVTKVRTLGNVQKNVKNYIKK